MWKSEKVEKAQHSSGPENGVFMTTVKGFWQHTNGKVYAVESTSFGKIVGGVGPLDPDNLRDLQDYSYTPAIVEWLQKAIAEHKLRRFIPTHR